MIPSPFKRVVVDVLTGNTKKIYWEIDTRFTFVGTPEFYVDFSRSTEDWEVINTVAITGVTYYEDIVQRRFSSKFDFYYRVRCIDNSVTYTSEVAPASGYLNRRDYLNARSLLRQLYKKVSTTGSGVEGYLLKRKEFGTACTTCLDFATGAVINTECSECYGTGFVGGYYTTVSDYFLDFSPIQIMDEAVKKPLASKDDRDRQAGAVYFPFLKTHDLFVEKHQNRRYIIEQIKPLIEISGVPLYSMLVLHLLPITRIEYNISI